MRTPILLIVTALLLQPAGVMGQGLPANSIDFGARATEFAAGSDQARSRRYRDSRDGVTLDAFTFAKDTDMRRLSLQANHVGYLDQHYAAAWNEFGRFKLTFDWNQIPLLFSESTKTLFSTSRGVLRISDAIQAGVQAGTTTLDAAVLEARPLELRLRRDVADFRVTYSATDHVDFNLSIKNATKTGNQPWGGNFGQSNDVELPVPVDTRTTDLGAGIEWANGRTSARLAYDGSFFTNNVSTLVWDNPRRATDSATAGPFQGRMAMWPNSNMHTGSATGSLTLPARSHATAYISVGDWSQDDPLIPFTINSALATIPLDRPTANADARVTSMNYTFHSRPIDLVSYTARYRSYEFKNRTPVFNSPTTVSYDTTVAAFAKGGTSPLSYTRRTLDADVVLTPFTYGSFRAGYTREQVDQTVRFFDTTTEDTFRVSADTTALAWLTLRGVYEHAKRVGSGFDELALDDIGEQVSLRQFDISDRTSNRFSGIVQVAPVPLPQLAVNGSVSVGDEDRPGAGFGLRSNGNHAYSIGVDFVPRDEVSMGVTFGREWYTALQASRQANPGAQFNDPTRDWTTNSTDTAQTLSASLDLLKAWPKTDVRMAYDYSRAESQYVYGLAPNSTLTPVVQLPVVSNELQRGTLDVRYHVTPRLALGLVYWYDRYIVNDFAQDPQRFTTLAQPSLLMMGYFSRPYTANTVSARLTYYW
ncbi:MAG: MtrB/PioB family outer membrane beta-barrel protein [Vicinamibacterales bacterium]